MNKGIHEECDHFVQLAKDKVKKSMVADIESSKSVESKVHISFGMFLNKAQVSETSLFILNYQLVKMNFAICYSFGVS
ncbi:putative prolyl 4-hydroxylase 7 [Camellia lanceoleosa]|uniref:Prolyl 4-hydroxylase 7 n=1 Tax=Camellia lanceoleosa TaxID=1840588 RepID=A0ACC0G393_9ERIC|nr:putative prolyl 4-hydroxylase 7 [Camellia lanceoleosa]